MKNRRLQSDQLNEKMLIIKELDFISLPTVGWIRTLRNALGMTLEQLGSRLNITKQSALEMEHREQEKSITLKSLEEAAKAMDMKLIYFIIPVAESLDALIEQKAKELATKIVMRTAHNMNLEEQGNSEARLKKAIIDRTNAFKNEIPKILWD